MIKERPKSQSNSMTGGLSKEQIKTADKKTVEMELDRVALAYDRVAKLRQYKLSVEPFHMTMGIQIGELEIELNAALAAQESLRDYEAALTARCKELEEEDQVRGIL